MKDQNQLIAMMKKECHFNLKMVLFLKWNCLNILLSLHHQRIFKIEKLNEVKQWPYLET